MKNILISALLMASTTSIFAQEGIKLEKPNLERGTNTMQAFANRQSTREFSQEKVSVSDMSDLFWAAFGVNREDGKRTAPSAYNAQDISLYAFMENGVYIYDYKNHQLNAVMEGDHRRLVAGDQKFVESAPLVIVYVSDLTKLNRAPDDQSRMISAAMNAAVISQNVSIFCASVDMGVVVRGWMDAEGIARLLKFDSTKAVLLNNVVGYKK